MEEEIEKTRRQVKILVDLIFARGLSRGLKVAARLEDPFVLSELYKTLTGEAYDSLIKRKKLKKT